MGVIMLKKVVGCVLSIKTVKICAFLVLAIGLAGIIYLNYDRFKFKEEFVNVGEIPKKNPHADAKPPKEIVLDHKQILEKIGHVIPAEKQEVEPKKDEKGNVIPPPVINLAGGLHTPDSSVKFATGDILTIPPELQPKVRYISLYNIPRERRRLMAAVISFVCNSLGTRKGIFIPEFVGASEETVVRINIVDYDWDSNSWENLSKNGSGPKAQPEPYFHYLIEEPIVEKKKVKKTIKRIKKIPNGKDQFNRPIFKEVEVDEEIEVEEPVSTKSRKISALAPWIDKVGITTLIELTRSESPIIRGDWFLSNVTVPPAYYDFLKLGNNIKDFQNLVFANQELSALAKSLDKGIVITSIVARNNRTLTRSPTFTNGYYWQSHDSLTSVDDRNYILNPLDEKFDATEDIGTLPNGLQAYFLTDGKGLRLDFANPDIAIDGTAVDKVVRTGRSCIICHSEGIKFIDDEVRNLTKLLKNKESIRLLATKEDDYYRIQDLFGYDLDERIIGDQNIYRKAVGRATGMTSEENAKLFSEFYDSYAEHLLTKEVVSQEVGLPPPELEKYIRMSRDPLLLGLIKEPIRPIRRDQWERSYQRFMLLILTARNGGEPVIVPVGTPLVLPDNP